MVVLVISDRRVLNKGNSELHNENQEMDIIRYNNLDQIQLGIEIYLRNKIKHTFGNH